MGKREEITDVSRVLKMLGQGWVGREHPSLSETREEEENAQMLWRRGLRCLNDSCFLEKRERNYSFFWVGEGTGWWLEPSLADSGKRGWFGWISLKK